MYICTLFLFEVKIICINNNIDLNSLYQSTNELSYFFKPDSCLVLNNRSFYIPDFSDNITYSLNVVFKINRLGKNISKRFAYRYYNEIGLGISLTANDLLTEAIKTNKPWDIATCFDYSSVIGDFINFETLESSNIINISIKTNNVEIWNNGINNIKENIDTAIEFISKQSTLKIGDYIYLPAFTSSKSLKIGDNLEGYLNSSKLVCVEIK